MIPKIIHYCWFGGNPKPEIIQKCMASWKQYCPDWEIREWNEENFDVSAMPYTQEAYEAKKWAFVSDVARLHAVYECGGIYMDTDVELMQSIDGLCRYDAVFAFETNLNINTGMGFGASRHHKSVGNMLKVYEGRNFLKRGKPDLSPCPRLNTEALRDYHPGFQRDGTSQLFDNVRVLSYGEYAGGAKHHVAGSWGDGPPEKMRVYKDTKFKRFLRKPGKYVWIEKHLGKKALLVYTFFSYDLMEMGPWFYIKRKLRKK